MEQHQYQPPSTPVSPEDPQIITVTSSESAPPPPDATGNKKRTLLLVIPVLLVIFSGAAAATFYLLKKPAPAPQPTVTTQALPTPIPFFLDIISPAGDVTAVNGEVMVSGKTTPDASVVVYTDTDDVIVEPDPTGMFETTILVEETGGLLRVSAYSIDGEEITHTFNIAEANTTQSTQVLGVVQSATFLAQGRSDQAPGRTKTQTEQSPKPTNGVGRGGPQTDTSPQQDAQVETFLLTKTKPAKPEKVGPAKLKQLISGTGTDSGRLKPTNPAGRGGSATATPSGQLKKLLVQTASPSAKLKRHALSGVVTAVNADSFTVAHQTQQDRISTVFFNSLTTFKIKGIENPIAANVTVGLRIISTGEPITNGLLANRIHVIPGKAIGVLTKHPVTPGATASATPIVTGNVTPTATASATPTAAQTLSPTPTPSPSPSPSP